MEHQSLTPATRAVLEALAALGKGNVHELAEKSGKARSTTDKAIRTLSEYGLIVEIDLGADAAEGTPARWELSENATAALDAADLGGESDAGQDETDDATDTDGEPLDDGSSATDSGDLDEATDEEPSAEQARDDDTGAPAEAQPRPAAAPRPADRKVMTIKGVLAEYGPGGATVDEIVIESGISHPTTIRILSAMEQADAARRLPPQPDKQERWITGPTRASEVDPNPEPPRCAVCFQVVRGVTSAPAAVAAVQSLIRPDGTLHVVAPDGETHVVKLPKQLPPRTVSTSAATPARSDASANGDGNQPFVKGELERLTIGVLAANPGRQMTPQEIATAISAQLGGRTVSSGAVRNNCTKAAAAGRIMLVSDAPLTFVFPEPPAEEEDEDAGSEPDDSSDSAEDDGLPEQTHSDQDTGDTEQS
jgi:hypothetical protein